MTETKKSWAILVF